MTSQGKEVIPVKTEIKPPEIPFQWGDELKSQEKKPDGDVDGPSYTSVSDLLKDEKEMEKKRLEEYYKNLPDTEHSK